MWKTPKNPCVARVSARANLWKDQGSFKHIFSFSWGRDIFHRVSTVESVNYVEKSKTPALSLPGVYVGRYILYHLGELKVGVYGLLHLLYGGEDRRVVAAAEYVAYVLEGEICQGPYLVHGDLACQGRALVAPRGRG